MTNWDKLSDEEKKKKYADMAMTYFSLRDSGDLDEVVEEEVEKLREELKIAEQTGDFTKANQLKEKIEKDGIILEETRDGIMWRWKNN